MFYRLMCVLSKYNIHVFYKELNMGIRKFFDNTKNAFTKAGKWMGDKFHKVKNGVVKFAKVASPIVKKGVEFISKTDLAKQINEKTGGAFDVVKDLTKYLPDGKVKNNVNNFVHKGEEVVGKITPEVQKAQDKVRSYIGRGQEMYNDIKNRVSGPPRKTMI